MPNAQFRSSSTTSTRTLSSWSVRMKNIKAQIINTCIAKNNSHSFLHNLKHNQTARWGRRTTLHRGRLSLSCCSIFTRARTTVMSSMAGNCHYQLANHGHRHRDNHHDHHVHGAKQLQFLFLPGRTSLRRWRSTSQDQVKRLKKSSVKILNIWENIFKKKQISCKKWYSCNLLVAIWW